ncbi:MAG: septal ring lytic transglycosylase RlpA family protein [Pseudomonadota bacterium]
MLSISMLMISCAGKSALVKNRVPGSYVINGKTYLPMKEIRPGYSQSGTASWYGPGFHGKKTASGEVYDMHAMTAAHSTLPLNTLVSVTNLTNRKTVLVRVNDRGPFVGERVIDVSFCAAQKLDMVKPGTAPIHFTVVGAANSKLASSAHATPAGPVGGPATSKLPSRASAHSSKNVAASTPNPFFPGKLSGLFARLIN